MVLFQLRRYKMMNLLINLALGASSEPPLSMLLVLVLVLLLTHVLLLLLLVAVAVVRLREHRLLTRSTSRGGGRDVRE